MLRVAILSAILAGALCFPNRPSPMVQDVTHTASGRFYEFSQTEVSYDGVFVVRQSSSDKFFRFDVGNATDMTARDWRYTGIYTKDGYYELGYSRKARTILCQLYKNWTYDGLTSSYSSTDQNTGLNYMGDITVTNSYAKNLKVSAYIGSVRRHPTHLDLTQQWIDTAPATAGLRRGGVNAMPGGWWMVYSQQLSKTGPTADQMKLPKYCVKPLGPVRTLGGATSEENPKMQVLDAAEDLSEEVHAELDNFDFTRDFKGSDASDIDQTATAHKEEVMKQWVTKGANPPNHIKKLKVRGAQPQVGEGFRPFLKRYTTTASGEENYYENGKVTRTNQVTHLEDVDKKIYRIDIMPGKSTTVNETYITYASGAFWAYTDPSTNTRKCEYTSTFNYDDLFSSFMTPPMEWYGNITFANGPNGPADTFMSFASMETPEFIGDFVFQRTSDLVETYFVDISPPAATNSPPGINEVFLKDAKAQAPTSDQLDFPAECKSAAKASCNYGALEPCVLKATAKTLLYGEVCEYMREMAFCFADNFCQAHLTKLCDVPRAAKCRVKQCAFPAGGCPPAC